MKNYILDKCMNLVVKDATYSEVKLVEIRYGLEAIYLTLSKTIVFMLINILLGNFLISLLFLLFYSPVKSVSYGFHAKTSLQCWLISGFGIIGLPILAQELELTLTIKIILIIIYFIFFAYLSPADTPRKPLVNKQKRNILKIYSLIILFIYAFIIIFSKTLAPIVIVALFYQCFLINPLTYQAFNTPYCNYLYYKVS